MRQETPKEETSIPAAQPLGSFGSTIDAPDEPHHQAEMDIYHGTSVSPPAYHSMDDNFAPESTGLPITRQATSEPRGDADMSLDTRRLRAQHNTVGYREGITAGKAASIQAGFDQGFSLGATIGTKAGQILGLLEGISNALADASQGEESAHAASLLARAAADLKPERLFTTEYWGPDGTWAYPVMPSDQDGEIIYPDVANQHPLIIMWSRIAREEAMRWSVDPVIPILESSELSAKDSPEARETTSRPGITSPDPLHW